MTRIPPPAFVPPRSPQVGDRVMFYFLAAGERLRSRTATIKQIWTGGDRTVAELDVDFTEAEVADWQFPRTQRHSHMTTHPISGSWVPLPVAT